MRTKASDAVDQHVGSRIRMRRLMVGMSQSELGEAVGVTFQQVQKYEKGTNRVGAGRLQQVSEILRVAPEFFFDQAPGQRKADNHAQAPNQLFQFLATSDGLALARAFTRLTNAKLRRKVVA